MKNKFYKLITFSLLFGGANLASFGQATCGTTQALQKLYAEHPELVAAQGVYDNEIAQIIANRTPEQRASTTVYTIPVVFHIIHQNGSENIPDANVADAMQILNEDYRKLNSDTINVANAMKPLISDSYIEFRLATIDPNGNCTNGIDRIYSHKTNNADDYSKLNGWPRGQYLNIWVVKTIGDTPGVAGYAYYPNAVSGPLYPADGILILYNFIGSIGVGSPGNSRALTHEIGHWLNLAHTWGSTNDPDVACGDDQVVDTPPTKGHNLTCSTLDMYNHDCSTTILNNVLYRFNDVTTTSGTTDPTSTTVPDNVLLSSFTANGVGANSAANGEFSFDGWNTGAPDGATTYASCTGTIAGSLGKYYEFTVTPKTVDSSMTLTGITFTVNRSATGPRTWVVRSSALSSFGQNLAASISPANPNLVVPTTGPTNTFFMTSDITSSQNGCKITLPLTNFGGKIAPVTFRIYAFNAEDAFGTFSVDSVRIAGTNGQIENTENYMDYSYCSKMYTHGQSDRMRATLESPVSQRNNLWSAANLAATGVSTPGVCIPYPDFYSNRQRICVGDGITYTKNVHYDLPAITSTTTYLWQFEGGTPSSSTAASPGSIVYNTPGLFKTTLTATNSAGTDSVVKTSYIRVDEDWADIDFNGSYTEDWEGSTSIYWDWQVNNYDNNANTWSLVNFAGYNGSSHSVVMAGYQNYKHDIDDLITPSYDLSYTSAAYMTFMCAAASSAGSASQVNDVLKVYVSKNCGLTWSLVSTFKDSTLINNGYQPNYFVPGSGSVWTERTVPISATFASSNTRFKFEYTTGDASNNVYIDYINLHGAVGIDENGMSEADLNIYPNPTNQTSTIAYHLNKKADTKVEVVDVLGKTVYTQANTAQTEGDYKVTISKQSQNLRNGIYFVKFSIGSETITKKLIITE